MRVHLKRLAYSCFIFFIGLFLLELVSINENDVKSRHKDNADMITLFPKDIYDQFNATDRIIHKVKNNLFVRNPIDMLFPMESNTFTYINSRLHVKNRFRTRLRNIKNFKQDYAANVLKRIDLQLKLKPLTKTDSKVILLYFNDKSLKNEKFENGECRVNNCRFSRKPEDFNISDVVIFKDVPRYLTRPLTRPNQLWIYYQLESPMHSKPLPKDMTINWTATYRADSILPTPYEIFKYNDHVEDTMTLHKRKTKNMVGEDAMKLTKSSNYDMPWNKTKLVATFISNCNDKNGRLEYIRKLQNHIKVDIYGRCGTLQCEQDRHHTCWKMLKNHYKFYLAFENSNCKDYITEKLFNALRYDVIPVVMGARISEYRRIAPPHSFIHVDDHESPEHLAEYLKMLARDEKLYNAFFRWKTQGSFLNTNFQCRLCSMVQLIDSNLLWYNDIKSWWAGNDTCMPVSKIWTSWKK